MYIPICPSLTIHPSLIIFPLSPYTPLSSYTPSHHIYPPLIVYPFLAEPHSCTPKHPLPLPLLRSPILSPSPISPHYLSLFLLCGTHTGGCPSVVPPPGPYPLPVPPLPTTAPPCSPHRVSRAHSRSSSNCIYSPF